MQTGPGLTEVERKSRRKSHTPGGRNDVTRVSHIEINGAVAPCALGAQALFEIETWTGRAGGREGVGGGEEEEMEKEEEEEGCRRRPRLSGHSAAIRHIICLLRQHLSHLRPCAWNPRLQGGHVQHGPHHGTMPLLRRALGSQQEALKACHQCHRAAAHLCPALKGMPLPSLESLQLPRGMMIRPPVPDSVILR